MMPSGAACLPTYLRGCTQPLGVLGNCVLFCFQSLPPPKSTAQSLGDSSFPRDLPTATMEWPTTSPRRQSETQPLQSQTIHEMSDPRQPKDRKELSLFDLFEKTDAAVIRAMNNTTSEVADLIANFEDAVEKYKYIAKNSEIPELRVRTHNYCIPALQLRCQISPSPEHREQYLQYFHTAAPDLRSHLAEYSFLEKWSEELGSAASPGERALLTAPLNVSPTFTRQNEGTPHVGDEKSGQARQFRIAARMLNARFERTYDPKDLAESARALR